MVNPSDGRLCTRCGRRRILTPKKTLPKRQTFLSTPNLCENKIIDPLITPIVWVLGGPGSGKGTQCEKLASRYNFCHHSTGELLRAELHSGSDRLHDTMIRGELVSNDIVLKLLKATILKEMGTKCNGFLIDGYPREKSQGPAFERSVAPCTVILFFEASEETLTKRILHRAKTSTLCREYDNEETIKLRLKTFKEHNSLVLSQYPDKLKVIDAERSIDAIFDDVVAIMDPIVQRTKDIIAMGELLEKST